MREAKERGEKKMNRKAVKNKMRKKREFTREVMAGRRRAVGKMRKGKGVRRGLKTL